MAETTKQKPRLSATKLLLIIVVLCLVPLVLQQLKLHADTVKMVGRVCVGLGALFLVYGLIAKAVKVVGVVLLALLVFAALAAEEVIQLPNLLQR
jgi:hypothetical protein